MFPIVVMLMLCFCLETIKRKQSYLVPSSVSNRNGRDSSVVCLLSNQRDFILRGICLFSVFPKAYVKCEVKRGEQHGCAELNCELPTDTVPDTEANSGWRTLRHGVFLWNWMDTGACWCGCKQQLAIVGTAAPGREHTNRL